jgi:hypothetical protein
MFLKGLIDNNKFTILNFNQLIYKQLSNEKNNFSIFAHNDPYSW